jgi:ABC-2 type transport system ATP-binding protein
MNAIEIKDLTKRYADFTLNKISFSLPSGCILGLVGENGAGKSTTINLIMNALSRDGGSIQVLGTDNRSPQFETVKEDIGVVLDEAYYPEVLNARNVNAVMKRTYRNWDEQRYDALLKKFDLPEKKMFRDFSRGMKMKLAIAVALSHRPRLLILDEATSGLDPIVRDEILDLFNDFTRDEGRSVLISSHIVSDLEKICDYIAFLHKGSLMLFEEKDRLLEEYAILKLTRDALRDIPPEAIRSKKDTSFGAEVLVLKSLVSDAFRAEHTTLEDIILFLAKGV